MDHCTTHATNAPTPLSAFAPAPYLSSPGAWYPPPRPISRITPVPAIRVKVPHLRDIPEAYLVAHDWPAHVSLRIIPRKGNRRRCSCLRLTVAVHRTTSRAQETRALQQNTRPWGSSSARQTTTRCVGQPSSLETQHGHGQERRRGSASRRRTSSRTDARELPQGCVYGGYARQPVTRFGRLTTTGGGGWVGEGIHPRAQPETERRRGGTKERAARNDGHLSDHEAHPSTTCTPTRMRMKVITCVATGAEPVAIERIRSRPSAACVPGPRTKGHQANEAPHAPYIIGRHKPRDRTMPRNVLNPPLGSSPRSVYTCHP